MIWRKKPKGSKESAEKRLKAKIKTDRKPLSWLFYLFIALLILAALNFALLSIVEISSLFFQLEFALIQFLNFSVLLHRWEIFAIVAISGILGIYLIPAVYIPSLGKHGKVFFYVRSWTEGDLMYFRLISGYYLVINQSVVSKRGLRYVAMGEVELEYHGNLIEAQTEALEVDISLTNERRIALLEDYITKLEYELRNSGIIIGKDEAVSLLKREKEAER